MALTPEQIKELDAAYGYTAQETDPRMDMVSVRPREPKAPQQEALSEGSPLNNKLIAGIYGAARSVPFAEKAAAGLKALPAAFTDETVKDSYNKERDAQKRLSSAFQESQPTASTVGYVGGAVLNPMNKALAPIGLLGNAALQAGSDTDFSKEGALGDLAQNTATNFAFGKLFQKGVGALTGSGNKQKAANYIASKIPAAELQAAAKNAKELAGYGVANAPAIMGGGENIKIATKVAGMEPRIADFTRAARDSITSILGKAKGKEDLGSLGKTVSGLYEKAKNIEISKDGFRRFLSDGSPEAGYVKRAVSEIKGAKPNSGEVIQRAIQNAYAVSVDEGDRVAKALANKFGDFFGEANKGYKLLQESRKAVAPFKNSTTSALTKNAAENIASTSRNPARMLVNAPLAVARKVLGSVGIGHDSTVEKFLNRPSGKVSKNLVDILVNKPASEAVRVGDLGSRNKTEALVQALIDNPMASQKEKEAIIGLMRAKEAGR